MSGSQKHPIVQEQKNTLRAMYLKAMACLTPRVMSLEVEFPNPQHPKGSREKSCAGDSQSTGEITLSCHHRVCDLLKEGFRWEARKVFRETHSSDFCLFQLF